MSDDLERFPHIELRFVAEGIAVAARGQRKQSERTSANRGDAGGHGGRLKGSVDSIISGWQETLEQRKDEGKPDLPQAVPFILQVDPNSFDADQLKSFGIEVIAELEDGYIIGASADLEFTELQKKIENCINGERGGGKIPEIWEILGGIKRPEYILSEKLLADWDQIKDDQPYTVDVGIACIGLEAKFPDYPERKADEDSDKYMRRVARWLDKRDQTEQEWDDLQYDREQEFFSFVEEYGGTISRSASYEAPSIVRLPDSFSCRIQISGKGLKDLVLTFPYVFDVSEPDEFHELLQQQGLAEDEEQAFELDPPAIDAPKVCVIDSGVQEQHPLLKAAIDDAHSRSWVPGDTGRTADLVANGGHGTRVAGAVLYPQTIPRAGRLQAGCWIQNARILDQNCLLPEQLFPPETLEEIVNFYKQTGTRIFNHSITGSTPCRTQYMSAWAAAIDKLTWDHDVLFIVSAGNLPLDGSVGVSRLSISAHFAAGRSYPDYLLEPSARVANPAQSFQALTVGSIAASVYHSPPLTSIAPADYPSAFTCCGLGIWESIKPEVVEYGGDLIRDEGNPPNLISSTDVCPELVRSTLGGGPVIASDKIGTSFAAPKVTHIAAAIEAELPQESCLLYRALIVQSARLPEWTAKPDVDLSNVLCQMGYGIPNLDRAIGNTANRITLITRGEQQISARKARVYQVQLPQELRSPGESYDILVEVTLSYKAEPRRTRRQRRKYLSTWLDWECSKRGEDPEQFLARVLKDSDASEETEKGEGLFEWTLGKQRNWGKVKGLSRGAGTVQKDWAIVKSYDLREAFCLAIVGHEGWNNDPNAEVPYSLVVSFEALGADVPIYAPFVEVQTQIQVQQQLVEIQQV